MHHRATVLLVHDDIATRLRLGNWLLAAGYRCVTADDSASALRFAGRMCPDVAVIDLGRKDRDRLWLADRLRERANPVGVVLMSGSSSSARVSAAARPGVAGPIEPGDPEELLDAVGRAARWRETEEIRALDARQLVMATVAARHEIFKRTVSAATTAEEVIAAVGATFRAGEPPVLGHARRVAQASVVLARALHLSPRATAEVQAAALLHDLGKVSLPEAVLSGEIPVGDSEMEALLDHHSRTLDLVNGHAGLQPVAALLESVFEWWDGRGYPLGVAGRDIPFGARIVAAADVFDAARTGFAPDDTWAHRAAGRAALVRDAGSRLDPDLVRVYLHLLDVESCS